jgi:hypothetical protein
VLSEAMAAGGAAAERAFRAMMTMRKTTSPRSRPPSRRTERAYAGRRPAKGASASRRPARCSASSPVAAITERERQAPAHGVRDRPQSVRRRARARRASCACVTRPRASSLLTRESVGGSMARSAARSPSGRGDLPQRQHHEVLRVSEPERLQNRSVDRDDVARGGDECEAQLVVELGIASRGSAIMASFSLLVH